MAHFRDVTFFKSEGLPCNVFRNFGAERNTNLMLKLHNTYRLKALKIIKYYSFGLYDERNFEAPFTGPI